MSILKWLRKLLSKPTAKVQPFVHPLQDKAPLIQVEHKRAFLDEHISAYRETLYPEYPDSELKKWKEVAKELAATRAQASGLADLQVVEKIDSYIQRATELVEIRFYLVGLD
jgi:hypothetical protein